MADSVSPGDGPRAVDFRRCRAGFVLVADTVGSTLAVERRCLETTAPRLLDRGGFDSGDARRRPGLGRIYQRPFKRQQDRGQGAAGSGRGASRPAFGGDDFSRIHSKRINQTIGLAHRLDPCRVDFHARAFPENPGGTRPRAGPSLERRDRPRRCVYELRPRPRSAAKHRQGGQSVAHRPDSRRRLFTRGHALDECRSAQRLDFRPAPFHRPDPARTNRPTSPGLAAISFPVCRPRWY